MRIKSIDDFKAVIICTAGYQIAILGYAFVHLIVAKDPFDEVFDARLVLGSGGGQGSTDFLLPETREAMEPVFQAYRAAHNGQWQTDLSELQPYATTPEQQAALQKMILRNPASK